MPDYLIHYNKNHSKANGQFTSGDGDGDGIVNDHANRSKESNNKSRSQKLDKKYKARRAALIAIGAGVIGTAVAGIAVATVENKSRKGKTWYENSKSYQKVVADATARQQWKNKYQPDGWDKDVKFKSPSQTARDAWDTIRAARAKDIGGDW